MRVVASSTVAVGLLLLAAAPLGGQVQQQGGTAGRLVIAGSSSQAATQETQSSLDDLMLFSFASSAAHARRALELDPKLGLARAQLAWLSGGATAAAELDRAAADAATASLPEALLAQGLREYEANRAQNAQRVFALAAELTPNDPRVALEQAIFMLGGKQRQRLREVSERFPQYAPAKIWLAYYLTENGFDRVPDSVAAEALRAAGEAVKLAPDASGSHTIMGHVLERLLRHDEAMPHLMAATRMTPTNEWAYAIEAEIAIRDGHFPQARAALDSAASLSPTAGRITGYRIAHAVTFLYEGELAQTVDSLSVLARELEAAGASSQAAVVHLNLAIMAAAAHDSAGVDSHVADGMRLHATPNQLADNGVIAYALLGDGTRARRTLEDYVKLAQPLPPELRDPNVHRMTGLTLLAERKPAEAVAELKQGGDNPYAQLGLIEAYRMLGDRKQADAERAALMARKNIPLGSTAIPIARYRASRMGR